MYDTFMAKLWILDWTLFDTWRRVHPWTLTQDRPSSPQQEPWSGYCWQRKAQRRARSCGARQENRPPFGFLWGGMGVVVLARADGSGEVGSLATSSWPADPLPHQDSDSGRSEIWWNENWRWLFVFDCSPRVVSHLGSPASPAWLGLQKGWAGRRARRGWRGPRRRRSTSSFWCLRWTLPGERVRTRKRGTCLTLTSSQACTTSSGGSPSSRMCLLQELKLAASGWIYFPPSASRWEWKTNLFGEKNMLHRKCSNNRDLAAKPAEGAFDAFCPGGVVPSWHELATATPCTSGFALFILSLSLSILSYSLMDNLEGKAVGQSGRGVVAQKTLAKALRLSSSDHPTPPRAKIFGSKNWRIWLTPGGNGHGTGSPEYFKLDRGALDTGDAQGHSPVVDLIVGKLLAQQTAAVIHSLTEYMQEPPSSQNGIICQTWGAEGVQAQSCCMIFSLSGQKRGPARDYIGTLFCVSSFQVRLTLRSELEIWARQSLSRESITSETILAPCNTTVPTLANAHWSW